MILSVPLFIMGTYLSFVYLSLSDQAWDYLFLFGIEAIFTLGLTLTLGSARSTFARKSFILFIPWGIYALFAIWELGNLLTHGMVLRSVNPGMLDTTSQHVLQTQWSYFSIWGTLCIQGIKLLLGYFIFKAIPEKTVRRHPQ